MAHRHLSTSAAPVCHSPEDVGRRAALDGRVGLEAVTSESQNEGKMTLKHRGGTHVGIGHCRIEKGGVDDDPRGDEAESVQPSDPLLLCAPLFFDGAGEGTADPLEA